MGTVSDFSSLGNNFELNNVEICDFILWKVKLKNWENGTFCVFGERKIVIQK